MLVRKYLNVSCEDSRRAESFETELQFGEFVELCYNDEDENQDHQKSRVNTFDSATVKIDVRKAILFDFFDDNLRYQVPRNYKENVNPDESTRHKFRKSMVNYHCNDGNGSKTVNVRFVCC